MKKFVAFLFVFLTLSAVLTYQGIKRLCFEPLSYDTPMVFDLKKGMSAKSISVELARLGLAPHPAVVYFLLRFEGFDKNLKAGEYLLDPKLSLKDVLQKLTSGKVIMHRLTLPEGLTTAQMLEIIRQNDILTGKITESALEGQLLPETYTFPKGQSRNGIVKKAKADMKKNLDKIWQNRAPDLPLKDKNELLILASIIEKETGVNAERAKVASVFYNRLKINMPLQTDPTVIYAITNGKSDLGRALTRKDLQTDSPYNTYLYKGLPPTPICNAGRAALEAAANPLDTPYLYFVADGAGGHRFAKTLSEHNNNVRLWLKK